MNLSEDSNPKEERPSHDGAPTAAKGANRAWPLVERRSGLDRRVKRHFVFMDHRTGFDRRKRSWFFGTLRDSQWALIGLLVLLNVFSLIDGVLTALELMLGIAAEGNPVLGNIIQTNGFLAAGLKVAVMIVVSAVIWRWRDHRRILAIVPFALALYVAVLAYHFGSLVGLGWL
jgi:hypothetical protein